MRSAYSLNDEKTIEEVEEEAGSVSDGMESLKSSSSKSGARRRQGHRQRTVTGEGIEEIPATSLMY
jgi:hypothetical protein